MKSKLVLIEDDQEVLESLERFFSYGSYEVHSALSGEDGLTMIHRHKPDLVILDVMLPGIDGFEICRQIKEISSAFRPKVILLTALSPLLNKMEKDWLHKTGAEKMLTKPVDEFFLGAVVEEILSH